MFQLMDYIFFTAFNTCLSTFKFKTYFIYPISSALRRVERLLSNIYTNYDTLTAPPDLWRNMFLMLESTLYLTLIDHSHCPSLSYPSGGTSGGRTRDLLFAGQVLSQLSYSPINKALRSANRTFVDYWNFCFSNRQNFYPAY